MQNLQGVLWKEMFYMKRKSIKIIGMAVTIIGIGVELLSDWVDERKLDEMIDEKINKAFENREEES